MQEPHPFMKALQNWGPWLEQSIDNVDKMEGRINRAEFFIGSIGMTIIFSIFLGICYVLYTWLNPGWLSTLMRIAAVVIMGVNIFYVGALAIKRLHDTNKNAAYVIFLFLPILNLFLLFFLCQKGSPVRNRYGLVPPSEPVIKKDDEEEKPSQNPEEKPEANAWEKPKQTINSNKEDKNE